MRLDVFAVLAPEVRFPVRVETELLGPVIASEVRRFVYRVSTQTDAADARRDLLVLRVLIALGDTEHCTSFHDAQSRDLQWEVLAVRKLDQLFERWIVEAFPPGSVRGWLCRNLRIARYAPIVVDLHYRL